MAIFDPIQNRHPLTDRQKICRRCLRQRPLQLCQVWCTSALGGLLGELVKYNLNYFYSYPLFGQVRLVDGFSRMMAQTTRTRVRMCFFGFRWYCFHLGGKIPPKQFRSVNRRFQAKLVKSKNMHIIKTTASIPTKFCTVIKTTKCPSWVVRTHT